MRSIPGAGVQRCLAEDGLTLVGSEDYVFRSSGLVVDWTV